MSEEKAKKIEYKCGNCSRNITKEEWEEHNCSCPYCRGKYVFKIKPDLVRNVKAR